jgi:mRNA interferase RelE/StbE
MKIVASHAFLRFKKKVPQGLQLEIDTQVRRIEADPEIGELKKGDLQGIRVHKFAYNNQRFLLSYEVAGETITLYVIGPHENFYQ